MPQTRFVTQKALELGLRPIVVVNKIDRPGVDPHEVDRPGLRPVRRRSARPTSSSTSRSSTPRAARATRSASSATSARTSAPLLDLIVEKVPPRRRRRRRAAAACRSRRSTTTTTSATSRSAACAPAAPRSATACCSRTATARKRGVPRPEGARLPGAQALRARRGDRRRHLAITGMQELNVGETITDDRSSPTILPLLKVDAPTITMNFRVNDGPFAGKEGKYVTSRNLRERLYRELKSQRRAARRGHRRRRRVRGLGPRRAAPVGADRDDAPRGLRAVRLAAAGHPQDRRRTASCIEPYEDVVIDLDEAYSARSSRSSAAAPARCSEMRPSGAGPHAPRVPHPGARPHRLPLAVPDRHARHRRPLHAVRRLRPVGRRDIRSRARTAC